jgi:hypothetical protein
MNNLQEQKIKKLISFDFDDTLVHTLLPAEGKMIWKEKTGEDWQHRAWWSRPESLDMGVFDIPLNKKIYKRYRQAISDPDNYVILATGRVKPLQDEVYKILGHYGLSFDETHLNPGIDTFEFKSNLFAKLIYELQPEEFVMYDDRQEHLVKFVQWANAMPCKVTIIDAISGEEFKPKSDTLQESIRRILKEETKLPSFIRRRFSEGDINELIDNIKFAIPTYGDDKYIDDVIYDEVREFMMNKSEFSNGTLYDNLSNDEWLNQLFKFEEPLRDYVRSVIVNIYNI